MTARTLPPPIKPRALQRSHDGYGYNTSDGRYEITPAYSPTLQGGSAARPSYWIVKDLTDSGLAARDYATLAIVRDYYCAPGGKVPWLVCDMDDGIVRVEPSRAAAVEWACNHEGGDVIGRERQGEGWYDYTIGRSRDDSSLVWIARADVVHRDGFDPVQQPMYPFPDDPYEQGPRSLAADEPE